MKITNVEALPITDGRTSLLVFVDTDEGIWGVGEAALHGRARAVIGAIEHFKEVLIGADPFRSGHLWQLMMRGGFFPGKLILSSAASAVDIALWDIKGKALGVPIYDLIGGRHRDKVPCYPHNGSGHSQDIAGLVESCLKTKEQGWKFVRFGTSQTEDIVEPRQVVRADLKRVQAVREAVGEEIEICFDCHTRLDLPDALWFCREVEQFAPHFIEDPLRSENPDSFKTLRPRTGVPIAAGEQFGSKWQFRQLIEEEWIDYARTDLCIVGGITETLKIAGWCETHYIKMVTHNPLGPVSSAACFQLNMAVPNVGVQEQPGMPNTTMTNVIPEQIGWEDGYMVPNGKPGLGITVDRDAARAHVADLDAPRRFTRGHMRRLDGGFTNW